ncbi:hypothetical protein [Mycolicibacterium sphagni]|uniref:Uncharacterized protein n=1 Tax=Mycolicibacterium sphagni TaxID=1786 RepID=A0A255DMF3_9MYCO|nr:hypothetical protein [Mycolicibacterium sphagni]OYN76833.1 hypothetical protein CG716_20175 [Mycolicibacterium sphagni]
MPLRTREPNQGQVWPLVLLEGPELSGKSFAAAEFTASERVGDCYWLPVGESDDYGQLGNYVVVEHDGSWHGILDQVGQVHAVAQQPAAKPTVLVVDSMTFEWELLKDWITVRARESRQAQKLLREDPNADIKLSNVLWDDASERHAQLMGLLTTFNGIVVVTARCRETVAVDSDGRPIVDSLDYRVDAHRGLTHQATVWVRMSRQEAPTLIGCRCPDMRIRPGVDTPLRMPEFTLGGLLFNVLGYTADAQPRTIAPLIADETELCAQARAAIRAFTRDNELSQELVLQAFFKQHGMPLKDCTDLAVLRGFLQQLKTNQEQVA